MLKTSEGKQVGFILVDVVSTRSLSLTIPKGLGHALVAGTTSGTIVNPKTTRTIAEASGLTWTEGRSETWPLLVYKHLSFCDCLEPHVVP